MEIEILNKAESTEDFALHLEKVIKYLDNKTFDKTAKVSIRSNKPYMGMPAAGFSTKRWLFRRLGLLDDYFIFQNSKHLEVLSKLEYGAICCGLHEVRHRFQHYNANCLITLEFARQHVKYFPKGMFGYLYVNVYQKYGDRIIRNREFDASLIESLVSCLYKNQKMTIDVILDLITCNESNILPILSKLK